jgi:hypothetical protein
VRRREELERFQVIEAAALMRCTHLLRPGRGRMCRCADSNSGAPKQESRSLRFGSFGIENW